MRGRASTNASFGHSVHVELAGLAANSWFRYRFALGGHESIQGRARTLPNPGAAEGRLTLCVASCQQWEDGYYVGYRHMAKEQPDYVLFLGDYIYEYAGRRRGVRTHSLPAARDLDGYRLRYALYKSDADLQAMHAQCTWIVVPDDHDVEDNYAGRHSFRNLPDFGARKAAALQAYFENMPMRGARMHMAVARGGLEPQLHQRYSAGLAGLHVLDTRQYRTLPGRETDGQATMLGAAQELWLAEGLGNSRSPWNMIAVQSRFSPANYAAGRGRQYGSDTWDAFPSAREQLLRSVSNSGAKGVVFLCGDIHQFWVSNIHRDPYDVGSEIIAAEFCTMSISSAPGVDSVRAARSRSSNPHCLLNDVSRRGYLSLTITPERVLVSLRQVVDVADPDSASDTLAGFEVTQREGASVLSRLE